jgi:hypothetical protein
MMQKQAQKSEYDVQAETWATKYGVRMSVVFLGHYVSESDKWEADKDPTKKANTRDHYEVTLERTISDRTVRESVTFGQSLANSSYRDNSRGPYWSEKVRRHNTTLRSYRSNGVQRGHEPSLYNVLACLQKHEPGTFKQFCGDFGYDTDSRRALTVYESVQEEYEKVLRLCGGDAEMLREWQEIS